MKTNNTGVKKMRRFEKTMTDEEMEEIRSRQIRRENIEEFLGCIAFAALVVAFVWLYIKATPAQGSGEYDRAAEALRAVDATEGGAAR